MFVPLVLAVATAAGAADQHSGWDRLLGRYVENGLVDYVGLAAERAALDTYLAELAATSAETFAGKTRDQRLAFWINAYNAHMVALVLDHYPIQSIWKITPFWQRISGGPFALEFIPLGHLLPATGADAGAAKISLAKIEHGVLREVFKEPRVHFALVCASRGCPVLRSHAYEAERLDGQLDAAAREFLRTQAKNRYDARHHTLYISPIFKWFAEDFAPGGGPVGYLRRYGAAGAAAALAAAKSHPALRYTDYDWSLNEQPR